MTAAMERALPGVSRILDERVRQKTDERFTDAHDDQHDRGQIAAAGACYALVGALQSQFPASSDEAAKIQASQVGTWPWSPAWWKPSTDPVRNLEVAGALLAAEIDRLLRARGDHSDLLAGDACYEMKVLLGDMTLPIRLLKVQEETGEAADAYIGWVGANPRKGVTNDRARLEEELLDVALTALIAWCDVTHGQEPLVALERHARARVERHLREVPDAV